MSLEEERSGREPRTSGVACLRCGDFERGAFPVAGLALCARCLEGDREEPALAMFVDPPASAIWRQYVLAATLFVLGFAGGAAFVILDPHHHSRRPGLAPIIGAGTAAGMLALMVGSFVGVGLLAHLGMSAWRRELAAKLGFVSTPEDALPLVLYIARETDTFSRRLPGELGLLLVDGGGLAFFGANGTRRAFGLSGIVKVSTERNWNLLPPQTAVKLELEDGTSCFFRMKEGPTWAANKARAVAIARRLEDEKKRRASS